MKRRGRKWGGLAADAGFGCFFFDYDLDGWPDFWCEWTHRSDIQKVQANVKYAEPRICSGIWVKGSLRK